MRHLASGMGNHYEAGTVIESLMSLKLESIRLLVSKFDECFRFYKDVMGFEVTWGDEGSGYASFKTSGNRVLSIFKRGEQAKTVGTEDLPSEAKVQDRFVLVFRSRNVDKRLKRMKGKCTGPILGPADYPDWGIRAAYIRDPDGNLIEIHSPLPVEAWSKDLRLASSKYSKRD
jgi:catechol 2,3-dioxygenase-like lactoylglutathione lyase family enzyme